MCQPGSLQFIPGPCGSVLHVSSGLCKLAFVGTDTPSLEDVGGVFRQSFVVDLADDIAILGLFSDGTFSAELHLRRGEASTAVAAAGCGGRVDDGIARLAGTCKLHGLTPEAFRETMSSIPWTQSRHLVPRRTQVGGWDCTQILAPADVKSPTDALLLRFRLPPPGDHMPSVSVQPLGGVLAGSGLGCVAHGGLPGLCRYVLLAEVLANTAYLPDGPLVAIIEFVLPSAIGFSIDAGVCGAKRLLLHHLALPRADGRAGVSMGLTLEPGPIEAVLSTHLGPFVGVCAVQVEPSIAMAAMRAPSLALVPPVFVGAVGGVHCVLSHEVLTVQLPGLSALAAVPQNVQRGGERMWHGVACIALLRAGDLFRLVLEGVDSLGSIGEALPPEERTVYRLSAVRIGSDPALMNISALSLRMHAPPALMPLTTGRVDGAAEEWLLCVWPDTDHAVVHTYHIALKRLSEPHPLLCSVEPLAVTSGGTIGGGNCGGGWIVRSAIDCCRIVSSCRTLDTLCMALCEIPIGDDRRSVLELWHPGVNWPMMGRNGGACAGACQQASAGLVGVLRLSGTAAPALRRAPWPGDTVLLAVGEDLDSDGVVVAATSRSCRVTQAFHVPSGDRHLHELESWGHRQNCLTHHMRIWRVGVDQSGVVLQITRRELVVFAATSVQRQLKLLCERELVPFCCHGVTCARPLRHGGRVRSVTRGVMNDETRGRDLVAGTELWAFVASAAVLARYDVTVKPRAAAAESCQGPHRVCSHQIAVLCMVGIFGESSDGFDGEPRVAIAFWLRAVVAVVDGMSLAETCRVDYSYKLDYCQLGAPLQASAIVSRPGGCGDGLEDLLLSSVSGHLVHLRFAHGGSVHGGAAGMSVANIWHLSHGPLQIVLLSHTPPVAPSFPTDAAGARLPLALIFGSAGVAFMWMGVDVVLPCCPGGATCVVALQDGSSLLGCGPRVVALLPGGLLSEATLELEDGPVLLARTEVRGDLLAVANSPRLRAVLALAGAPPDPAITASAGCALALLVLGDELFDVLGVVRLGAELTLLPGASASMYDIFGGTLVAVTASGSGAPQTLVRLTLERVEDAGGWLDDGVRSMSSGESCSSSVLGVLGLDEAGFVATHIAPNAPVLLATGERLRLLGSEDLAVRRDVTFGELGLGGRGVVSALCVTRCQPSVAIAATIGGPLYLFVAFAAGTPAVLHLDLASLELIVLRLVPCMDPPRLPLVRAVAAAEVGGGGGDGLGAATAVSTGMPCAFVGFDVAGRCFTWSLVFDDGPLRRPSVKSTLLPVEEPRPPGLWTTGFFTPRALSTSTATHEASETLEAVGQLPGGNVSGLLICFPTSGYINTSPGGDMHTRPGSALLVNLGASLSSM